MTSRHIFVDYNTRRQGDLIPLDGYRDFVPHAVRRKPWTRALNSGAVKDYEADVHDKVKQLVDSLEAKAEKGQTVNISDWMSFFACVLVYLSASSSADFGDIRFDFMGAMMYVSHNFCRGCFFNSM